ncbi:phytanoyl-CoA dioxygenase family protein [Rhodopirellula sallentina]|uniref:Phytanoyl-CoA dioxygenase n=1 Tax=Rhodopirellula sallentina SM41 TaxID=1263870 RepID=M5TVC9_9BACT|nr:phytanoyl-CoA dioxygenase family protein [Rhodopirellula sallentina]EMI53004.1 Phytanoyl-CoA dioxygenase [Rhodopirellula sallentina SM41]
MKDDTDFAIIPDRKSIATVQRDIRFSPTENDSPSALTRSQIEDWNRDGYLGPLDVLTHSETESLREYFDELLRQTFAEGKDSYSISSAHLKHARVWDLLANPTIVAYVKDLLGENVIGWGSHFFCKMPGDGKRVDWHQDCSYWPLTPTKAVTVWLAIDDADLENGGMEVYTGSHRHGLIDFDTTDADSGNVLDQVVSEPQQYGEYRFTPIQAGQISIHSDLLVHGSAPNASDRRRCGLTLRYCPADVTAYLNWERKGVVVAGTAKPERWPGAVRPMPDVH